MARGLWSGAISFGLINIPVSVMSAREERRISFRMLDKADHAPIGYKQVNKSTGKPVERKNIVKGYEYEKNQFVVFTDADFKKANPKATRTIDIEDFVELEELDPLLFEQPYYLVPGKNGEKGYVLLKRTLEKTKKVAIANIVMHARQHLVAIMARGDYLILETLRYAREIREVSEAKFLDDFDLEKVRISPRELEMAQSLVDGMTADWKPQKYKDTYQDDLMKHIQQKIKSGDVTIGEDVDVEETPTDTNIVDLMPLLKKSLAASRGGASSGGKAAAGSRSTTKAERKTPRTAKKSKKARA